MATRCIYRRAFGGQGNVTNRVLAGAITGRGMDSIIQVPGTCLEGSKSPEFPPVLLPALVGLAKAATQQGPDAETIQSHLRLVLDQLQFLERDASSSWLEREDRNPPSSGGSNASSAPGPPEVYPRLAQDLYACKMVPIFLGVLTAEDLLPRAPTGGAVRNQEELLKIKCLCLEVLRRLCIVEVQVAQYLIQTDDVLHYCFQLLSHSMLAQTASEFIEQLVLLRKDVLQLSTVPHLRQLLANLDVNQVAQFCPVLAVTISDLDMFENRSSLYAQNKMKQSEGYQSTRDLNQEFLLSVPGLVSKLAEYACRLPYSPRYPLLSSEIDHWMRWIDDRIADDLRSASPSSSAAADAMDWTVTGGCLTTPSLGTAALARSRMSSDLVLRVEVVYVLGLLLVGRQRRQVQAQLAQMGFVQRMNQLFDQFIWRGKQRSRLPGHHSGCECSPEVALKIQFLRLVHSFCDSGEHKHLLLSPPEWSELSQYGDGATLPTAPPGQLMCRGTEGLLSKVLEVLKHETSASTFRFWLCRAVESFLRGSCSPAEQAFLLRRGLLQHVLGSLLRVEWQHKEILQSSFDLLGELVKFNMDAFQRMSTMLSVGDKARKLISVVNSNLVDSNMFIRSVVLSVHYFQEQRGAEGIQLCENCCLLRHFLGRNQLLRYLVRLVSIITVDTLTQENISCLNTSLVMLMLSQQKGQLGDYLSALQSLLKDPHRGLPDGEGSDPPLMAVDQSGPMLLKNFRDLLLFWQEHYLHKDKDCSSLEKSCRISFGFWKEAVEMLVSEDHKSPYSLLHYFDTNIS